MKIHIEVDRENDLLYLSFGYGALEKGSVGRTVRVSEDIFVDLSPDAHLLGLEILNASKHIEGDPGEIQVDSLIGVKEAGALLGISKSNFVRDYGNKPRFPRPVVELGGGRIWLKSQVEEYAAARKKDKAL